MIKISLGFRVAIYFFQFSFFVANPISLLCQKRLPLSSNTIDYTVGTFQVNESGAALYRIPITMSPGTGGMQPNMPWTYSSQGNSGILGFGWALSGLSQITRCPTTVANDGFEGVSFDGSDKLCLDGERLIAIKGVYGADGTEEASLGCAVLTNVQSKRPFKYGKI